MALLFVFCLRGGAELLAPLLPNPGNRSFNICAVAEGGEAKVAFATRTEAAAGGADDKTLVEQLVEEIPTGHAFGGLQPDVGGVDAAETGGLGEGAKLDGALLGPFDLVDRVRDARFGDEGLVGGIEQ